MRLAPGVDLALPFLIGAAIVAAILSFLLTPIVERTADRLGVVDRPDHRRVNVTPVPRGGGLAVAPAFLVAAVGFLLLRDPGVIRTPSTIGQSELIALIGGGVLATLVGFVDDYWQLRARWQLAGQIGLAIVAVVLGATPDVVSSPFGGAIGLAGPIGIGFTVVWILGMINSTNFIDGLDGLSPGIGLIAAVTLGLISLTTAVGPSGQPFVAVLCFALAGSLTGFLRWNFHPATIFVGTSGVMFIGYTLALLSILGTAKVAVAMLVLGVPIIDTFWIIVRRIASRRSPFTPDRGPRPRPVAHADRPAHLRRLPVPRRARSGPQRRATGRRVRDIHGRLGVGNVRDHAAGRRSPAGHPSWGSSRGGWRAGSDRRHRA